MWKCVLLHEQCITISIRPLIDIEGVLIHEHCIIISIRPLIHEQWIIISIRLLIDIEGCSFASLFLMLTASNHLSLPTTLLTLGPFVLFFCISSPYWFFLCGCGRGLNTWKKCNHLLFIYCHNRSEDLMRHEWFHQPLCPPPPTNHPSSSSACFFTKIIMITPSQKPDYDQVIMIAAHM